MTLLVLIILAAWVGMVLMVLGLCASAARGDDALDEASPSYQRTTPPRFGYGTGGRLVARQRGLH